MNYRFLEKPAGEMQAMPLSKLKEIKTKAVNQKAIKPTVVSEDTGPVVTHSNENHHLMIAEAAYFRAMARGFEGGNPDDDWYAAEAEIEQAYGG